MNAPTQAVLELSRDRHAASGAKGPAYKTLMVHLEVGHPNPALLRIARDLADRFHAGVVGIAGCQPMQQLYGGEYLTGDLVQQDRDTIASELKNAETEFRNVFWNHPEQVEWRSCVTFQPLSDYIAREARCADLLITGVTKVAAFSETRHVNAGDLVMQAGRPVVVVPAAVKQLGLKHTVVAWKDTREARRAIADALPLLKASEHVTVVGLAREDALPHVLAHLEDVVGWLESHGVLAKPLTASCLGDDADRLYEILGDEGADMVVAGAYGHNRLREWALGGVTGDLLLCEDRCAFLSH
jgi:nucleotide-binding universal stress UspA family protein